MRGCFFKSALKEWRGKSGKGMDYSLFLLFCFPWGLYETTLSCARDSQVFVCS